MPMYRDTMLDKLRQHGLDTPAYDTDHLTQHGKEQELTLEDRLKELEVVASYLGTTLSWVLGQLRLQKDRES